MSNLRRRAFTLIEMMVVVVIFSLVLAIVVKGINKIETSSRRTETITRMRAVARALQLYRDDYGDVPRYNPTGVDFRGDGNTADGPGLWALVMLDYLSSYRYLNDAAADVGEPWISKPGGGRMTVIPGNAPSMEAAYTAYYGAIANPGGELTQNEEWRVYNLLARHNDYATTAATSFGRFDDYDERSENYCSWMMQDPYTREWKYQPVRATAAPGAGANDFPAADSTQSDYYHRQLSHIWTDDDSPRYLPASDTVITWSHLFRQLDRRTWLGTNDWGTDLVLFADGHVASLAGPATDATTDPTQARALQRPTGP